MFVLALLRKTVKLCFVWLEIIQLEKVKLFWNLSFTKRQTVVQKMLQDVAIHSEIQETSTNRFLFKSFF